MINCCEVLNNKINWLDLCHTLYKIIDLTHQNYVGFMNIGFAYHLQLESVLGLFVFLFLFSILFNIPYKIPFRVCTKLHEL